jgi:hypothetical protein
MCEVPPCSAMILAGQDKVKIWHFSRPNERISLMVEWLLPTN